MIFAIGIVVDVIIAMTIRSVTDYRDLWFWFIAIQVVGFSHFVLGQIIRWVVWKNSRARTIATYVREFQATNFPAPGDKGSMSFLEELSGDKMQSDQVRQLAHQIVVMVRTMNDLGLTLERRRYLDTVEEALGRL